MGPSEGSDQERPSFDDDRAREFEEAADEAIRQLGYRGFIVPSIEELREIRDALLGRTLLTTTETISREKVVTDNLVINLGVLATSMSRP